jgi:hypothetical protein
MAHSDSDTMTAKEKRNAADRARYASQNAKFKATEPIADIDVPVRRALDMVYVLNIRKSKYKEKPWLYVCDIDWGAVITHGALLDGKTGSLQLPRFNYQRATRLKSGFGCAVRWLVIEAIEKHITETSGEAYNFPGKAKWQCTQPNQATEETAA